jgi:hypothetical protein
MHCHVALIAEYDLVALVHIGIHADDARRVLYRQVCEVKAEKKAWYACMHA